MNGRAEQCNRYGALVSELAQRALAAAHQVKPLSTRHPSVAIGLPAAAALLGDAQPLEAGAAVLAGGATRYDDAMGFTRPVYHPLLVRLHALGGATLGAAALGPMAQPGVTIDLELWRCAALAAAGRDVSQRVDAALTPGDSDPRALHARQADDQLDTWTYRELAGLAALHDLAVDCGRSDWAQRAAAVAAHHQRVTQPDYTTYQPWGVAAFALSGCEAFADQQLHDAQTNLHVDRRCAAAVALILADARHTLSVVETSP